MQSNDDANWRQSRRVTEFAGASPRGHASVVGGSIIDLLQA